MSKRKNTYLQISLKHKEKKLIQEKAKCLGYKSVSAFLIDSAESHFKIELDLSVYRELAKEVNYVGRNINNLIRHIFTTGKLRVCIYKPQKRDF